MIPSSIKGALFAPTLLLVLFVLKVTCPSGNSCFADIFTTPVFLPLGAVYQMFGPVAAVSNHEPLFLLGYWALVGLLLGLVVDIWRRQPTK